MRCLDDTVCTRVLFVNAILLTRVCSLFANARALVEDVTASWPKPNICIASTAMAPKRSIKDILQVEPSLPAGSEATKPAEPASSEAAAPASANGLSQPVLEDAGPELAQDEVAPYFPLHTR